MSDSAKNGFSLIEVLVSILVLSTAVLGAAGMQLVAMRSAQQAVFQTVALQLAAEMAEAMQATRGHLRRSGKNPFVGIDYKVASGEPPAPARLCFASECGADELAAFQIHEWEHRVKSALPSGRLVVCRDTQPWDSARHALTWDCAGESGDAPVVIKLGWQAKRPDGSLVRDAEKQFPPAVTLVVAL